MSDTVLLVVSLAGLIGLAVVVLTLVHRIDE